MTIGVNINIDVTKLQKEHFVKGKKGTYLDLVVFLNDEQDQYGNNGGVKQTFKDADNKAQPYIGNARVFWRDGNQANSISYFASNKYFFLANWGYKKRQWVKLLYREYDWLS